MRIPQSLLTAGVVVLMTALSVPGAQSGPAAECGPSGEKLKQAYGEASPQRSENKLASFAPVVEKVAPAVVRIVTTLSPDSPADLGSGEQDPLKRYLLGRLLGGRSHRLRESSLGSGVIATEDGYILTNCHLVNGANVVEVTLQDGREFKARIIGVDPESDLAVVRIPAHHLPAVPLPESRNVRVGDLVLAIGHPFGVGQTVTHGIVSALDRGGMGLQDYESFIQTDAPINPGNSGGALVDIQGHLIGINTAILSSSGGNLGIGFAIPSEMAHKVMTDLVKHGYVVRGYLGVETQDLTPELAQEFKIHGVTGVLVGSVVPNEPAEKAGLEIGDVITEFDGKAVRDCRQLKLSVADIKPGQSVALEILRDGSSKTLRVTLSEASKNVLSAPVDWTLDNQDGGALHGVFVGEINSELRQQLKIPREVQGAVVFDIHPYTAAAQAGLRPGDVIQSINHKEIRNAGEVSAMIQSAKDRRALLRVWSSSGSHFILIEE